MIKKHGISFLESFSSYNSRRRISQTRDLYSKIDKNVNFYLSTFPAEINDKMFQNKGKTVFLGNF